MSKLINCKSCGAEISKKAKSCPKCGEPNKQKSYVWVVILIFILMTMAPLLKDSNKNLVEKDKIVSKNVCYEKDRMKTFNLFEQAFKKNGIEIKNLYWMSEQSEVVSGGYSNLLTFDGKLKRGTIWYDINCEPKSLKISSGNGKVKLFYYNVEKNGLKLFKTDYTTYN